MVDTNEEEDENQRFTFDLYLPKGWNPEDYDIVDTQFEAFPSEEGMRVQIIIALIHEEDEEED